MKLYMIRDRLIDYFMPPFTASDDKQAMGMVSQTVNAGGKDGIQQAPHHYELWRVAQINEQGDVGVDKEFLADCSSLVRAAPGTPGDAGRSGAETTEGTREGRMGALPGAPRAARAETHPVPGKTSKRGWSPQKAPKGRTRSDRRSPADRLLDP